MKSTFDWTWTVEDDEANAAAEVDVRLFGEYPLPFTPGSVITITGVKHIVGPSTKLANFPDDIKAMIIRDAQKDEALQIAWADEIAADAKQEHAETVAEYRREHRED